MNDDWLHTLTSVERDHWESKPQSQKDWWYENTAPESRSSLLRTEISVTATYNEFLHLPDAKRDAILQRLKSEADAARELIRQRNSNRPSEAE